ncbi:MAG: arsenite S-adenosylmethyltransferase [Candidatus Parabeggiatoa sp. nov. 1]|nr:MAG: arsenite S-adenosylmethyltransferase [Gammaproteobacteria bacterium]
MQKLNNDEVRQTVRQAYREVAKSAGASGCCTPAQPTEMASGCCASDSSCSTSNSSPKDISINLGYSSGEVISVPDGANMGLGCGNPQAIAALKSGETVLDLGSGGGFDCFLAATSVGENGWVVGVDMTSEMISKARENTIKAGFNNVEFRLGEIENLPVESNAIDVIISNCVINLSPEKQKVFNDAFRVLKPSGRLAISDIVATAELPEALQNDLAMLAGCMSGASQIDDLESMLKMAGFTSISIKPKDESKQFIRNWAPGTKIEDFVVSATIEAVKP